MIRFFNTLSGRKEPFIPITPNEVKIYTCGPTVYDHAHIGNFRAYVFEDLLKRFLIWMGFKVTHIMNITDIDDKTIRGSNERGIRLEEYTQPYIESFFQDLKRLRILPADRYPRATEHIPEMVAMIRGLLEKGYAYEKDGSYYFSISRFPPYGRLSKISLADLRPGQRVETDEYEKESVHDFVLWKAKKEGEPFWETELGPGRPGWHIECSAMSRKYLGETFDIHCGGVDNIFPHHENEIAQSEAFSGKKFVRYWLHCHHLIRDGEKMSKSRGNTITIGEVLRERNNPRALRFLLLSTHYRKQLNFTFKALDEAAEALDRIDEFAGRVKYGRFSPGETGATDRILEEAEKKFRAGLGDDLNISVSITALFNLIKKANTLLAQEQIKQNDAQKIQSFLSEVDRVLAIIEPKKKSILKVEPGEDKFSAADLIHLSPEVREKIELREKARAEKNFALADALRRELLTKGILIEDTKEGPRIVKVGQPRE